MANLTKAKVFKLTKKEINAYRKFEELKAVVSEFEQERKEALKEYFRELLADDPEADTTYEDENVVITYRKPSTKMIADTSLMKKNNIFDEYSKASHVSDSVTIKVKYDE